MRPTDAKQSPLGRLATFEALAFNVYKARHPCAQNPCCGLDRLRLRPRSGVNARPDGGVGAHQEITDWVLLLMRVWAPGAGYSTD
jgi:hypothetical protein